MPSASRGLKIGFPTLGRSGRHLLACWCTAVCSVLCCVFCSVVGKGVLFKVQCPGVREPSAGCGGRR
eukprot:2014657-Prymnesium_polylepis.1